MSEATGSRLASRRRLRRAATAAVAVALTAPASAGAKTLKAEAVLPPGQSGFVSISGLPSGTGSPHLTDQTQLFVDFDFRSFMFRRPGREETPRAGVRIVRDRWGVPSITGATDEDAWWGVGYAVAQDRLFQLELFQRAGAGTLAEILGREFLDDDLVARRDYYTPAELDRQLAGVPGELLARARSYRDGVNAWVDHVQTHPQDLPGEFAALGVQPQHLDLRDIARIGVLLARTVPSGDGNELENAQALAGIGARAFNELHPVRTPGALPTIRRGEGAFKSQPGRDRRDERIGFRRSRRFLRGIDLDASGPGTLRAGGARSSVAAEDGEAPGDDLRRLLPTGGSYMWAIRHPRRDRAFLFNGPQLGFSIPELFVEFELHSPEQRNLRGVSAAGIPLVGIGHNNRVAWGFTSGLSDEDDLYALRLRGAEQYAFRGNNRRMSCRDETFAWREAPTSLPGLIETPGLPAGRTTERICRTVHGPVQYRGEGVAYARRYAIWGRELETIVGLDKLNRARNITDVDEAMEEVTWNENVIAADDRGRIGYWHPGLHPLRPLRWDERLPYPGDGRAEWRGLLPRSKTPRVVDPKRNWVANWNNVPSTGWTNGDGPARERMTGNLHRYRLLASLVRKVARKPSYRRSRGIDRTNGTTAQQRPFADEARLRRARRIASGLARRTIGALLRWDGNYDASDPNGTVHPGVAIWEELKDQVERRYLARFASAARLLAGETGSSHEFDISNGEAHGLRTLGAGGYAVAARRTAAELEERFGSERVKEWREPRRMFEVEAQGAGAPPELPFFDRGTWNQSLLIGRSR